MTEDAAVRLSPKCNRLTKDCVVRFYYADQRRPNGQPADFPIDGQAHADMYLKLAHEARQTKWLVTFTKEEGRREFVGVDFDGETRALYDQKFGRS